MRFRLLYTKLSTCLYLEISIVDSFAYWKLNNLLEFLAFLICCTPLTNQLLFLNQFLSLTNGTNTQCQREF